MFLNGSAVLGRTISLIGVPLVVRKFVVQVAHEIITVGLGENAGRSYRSINGIAFYHTLVLYLFIFGETVAIDQQELRFRFHFIQRQVHGLERSIQNIDAVDLFVIDARYAVADGIRFNIGAKRVTIFFVYLFGIVQQGMKEAFR